MYIIELIATLIKDRRLKKQQSLSEEENEDTTVCKHIYIPIDSTMDYLACNNCGDVIQNTHKKAAATKNFFLGPK